MLRTCATIVLTESFIVPGHGASLYDNKTTLLNSLHTMQKVSDEQCIVTLALGPLNLACHQQEIWVHC